MSKPIRAAILAALALAAAAPLAAAARPHNSYVIFAEGKQWMTMNGSTGDARLARAARSGLEPLLFVRYGGRAYVIRDAATLRQAEAILAPSMEVGRRQGELGARQGALGARQGALGAQQARLGAQQINASAAQSEALGRAQGDLGRQQGELGQQQKALGRQQEALGREQERVSGEADVKLGALIEDSVKRGVAKRID